jgi:type 1 fimbria pilin
MTKILRNEADDNNTYNIGSVAVGEKTESIDMVSYDSAIIQYTVSNIGTNVAVGIEVSNNNVKFDNANTSNTWTTKTANGTYTFRFDGKSRYLRFYWVSASGGSPVIEDIIIFGG